MVQIFNIDTDEEHDDSLSEETDPEEAFAAQGSLHRQQQSRCSDSTFRTYEAQPATGVKMTPKIPPSFDGQSSWFEFEDLIDDWVNITTLSAEKLGPSLKNALTGNAEYYKKMLDNEQLRRERNGITYFKETLRPYFVKGACFSLAFHAALQDLARKREFVSWIARFEVASKKVMEAFMGLLDLSTVPQPDDFNFTGNAEYYKKMLDNEQLRRERNGITYFKETLRPYFVKGACFSLAFHAALQDLARKREFVSWIARFEVASKKVMEAFMGLLDLSTVPQPDDFNFTDIL